MNDKELCSMIVEEELTALEAIYPDCISRRSTDNGILVKMELAIDLGGPRRVAFTNDGTASASALVGLELSETASHPSPPEVLEATISYLPPFILDLCLPANYPLASPPAFLSAYFTHSWLSPSLLAVLLGKFQALWVEQKDLGEGVLWRIAESIVTSQFLEEPLHLIDADGGISIIHLAPALIRHQLLSYDASMNDASFAITSFQCAICFENRKGSACIRLACNHVFCKNCLRDGWGLAVREGDFPAVRCPDPDCVAKASQRGNDGESGGGGETGEEDVRRVLTEQEVTRWKWLRVQRDIARDPTIVHCPLQFCQSPVPAPKSHQRSDEDLGRYDIGWQKLRTCEACGFAFCIFCKKAWHGPITPCAVPQGSSFVQEYLSLPDDSPRRRFMERTLGRKTLAKLVRQYQEDEKNREWLENSTTQCPGCSVPCQKSHGCNHMTCARCSTHYCYRCGTRLDPKEPYQHFSKKGISCYNKLFDFEPSEQEEMDWGWELAPDL